MIRILTLPFRLLLVPFRVAAVSARVGWRSGRLIGPSRALFFGIGFAGGVLVTSPKARKLALTGVSRATAAVVQARRAEEPAAEVVVVAPVDGPVVTTD